MPVEVTNGALPVFDSLVNIGKALACPQGLGHHLAVASLGVLTADSAPVVQNGLLY